MRAALALALVVAGCGGAEVAAAQLGLSAPSALSAGDIAAVEILVFDGANAGCARVMAGSSPLDDAGLVVVAHALFTLDGTPKRLTLPAARALDFYAEAFATTAPSRMRIGRGCVTETLAGGSTSGVTITLAATNE